jgi:hypothetical protein
VAMSSSSVSSTPGGKRQSEVVVRSLSARAALGSAGLASVAAQDASRLNASADAVAGSAVYAVRTRPSAATSSIES